MRIDAGEVQRVGLRCVQTGLRAAAAVVVLADEDVVGEEDGGRASRRVRLERHMRGQVTFVESVEIDLEGASHMWLVVGGGVERVAVDFDGAVVAGRIRRGRGAGEIAHHYGNNEARRHRQHPRRGEHPSPGRQHLRSLRHGSLLPSPDARSRRLFRNSAQRDAGVTTSPTSPTSRFWACPVTDERRRAMRGWWLRGRVRARSRTCSKKRGAGTSRRSLSCGVGCIRRCDAGSL
jgi:hypothetical protein